MTQADKSGQERLAAALKPFGWTCGEDFWWRYHTDPWVFNLANAVERLTETLANEQRRYHELLTKVDPDLAAEFPREGWNDDPGR